MYFYLNAMYFAHGGKLGRVPVMNGMSSIICNTQEDVEAFHCSKVG